MNAFNKCEYFCRICPEKFYHREGLSKHLSAEHPDDKLSTYHNIKDKKERKKAQNVEAARRYRDKKKAESDSVFAEEAQLAERNKKLRSKAAEIENEVKTLKKLMIELGLVK